jgi:aminoglycoside phosphotransferase (APT) family kinase protein
VNAGTIPVRAEDAFDPEPLHAWLVANAPDVATAVDQPPSVEQFPGGASNLTYLLRYGDDPNREFVLRRPPFGHKAASAHDMRREVTVQRQLRPSYPLVPSIYAFCEDQGVIGAEFYVMERLVGQILRRELPPGVTLSPAEARALAETVIDAQADLHSIDPADAGLESLGRGPGYVGRQVSGWSRRYRDARTDDVPDAEDVMAWLDSEQPPDVGARLIHGDWRFDNLVLDLENQSIVGVLDWEMATIGDPLMDLGASLAYWVCADDDPGFASLSRQPTRLPGMPSRQEYVQRYLQRTGLRSDDWTFYEVFGLFRLAVILQQIWFRYRRGETTNSAFADFGRGTNVLVERAHRILRGSAA